MITQFKGEHRYLSNFWECRVSFDVNFYGEKRTLVTHSSEHAYQALKAAFYVDAVCIAGMPTPGEAKRLGKEVICVEFWEDIKLDVMERIIRAKFTQNLTLGIRLVNSGRQELQEGNTWNDTFWGIDLRSGEGENHLGKILMKIRRELWLSTD